MNGYLSLALAAARVVVVEEWPEMVSIGGSAIASRVDHVVPWAGPDRFIALSSEPDNVTELMAGHVSALIPQHATVALGVGKIADSIARQCISRRGLSITTGAITESVMYLDQAGALDPTAAINGMSVIGDSELVAWAADHPRVRLRSSTYVHEPSWLAMRDRFVVVLGALNIDARGNINCENAGGQMISGIGGAPDFARGAAMSSGGRCIVTLPSCDRSGTSTLQDDLVGRASLASQFVGAVVTEKGAAVRSGSEADWMKSLERIF